ncbi:MAG: CADD family putative folate metabolism protein [Actinomycetota bacterium]|nr:CADD family putative folate metabolism protein [Actinomycetota bacterium]
MDLIQQLDDAIELRSLLRHPFYTKWVAGELPRTALQEYARQYHAFESAFPRFLSALHSRCDRPDVRAALLDNLWDEEHGEANHQELWLRFAEGIGVGREDVRSAGRNAGTQGLVDTYWRSATEGPVAAGVAALYAYERQVPAVAQAKIGGLRRWYAVSDARTLGFFEEHGTLDIEHADTERRIVADLGTGSEPEVMEAAEAALDAWWGFLDGVDA